MRNSSRIEKFCQRLARAWEYMPDMRFGQFMMNVLGAYAHEVRDPWFPEEDEMIEYIEKWAKENSPYRKSEENNGGN